jgi:hypothetical protein
VDNIDTVGHWFERIEKLNENCSVITGIYNEAKNLDTRLYPHARYDGVSILLEYLNELGVKDLAQHLPRTPERPEPGLFRQLTAFFVYAAGSYIRPWPRKIRLHTCNLPIQPVKAEKNRMAWRIFSQDQSMQIMNTAKQSGGNLNSYFLGRLIPHLEPIWADKRRKISVGIPVSLREKLALGQSPHNRVSVIDIWLDETSTPQDITGQIQNALKRNRHFASWISLNLPRYIGKWFYDYVLTIWGYNQRRNLIYSNLGDWSAASSSAVFFIPPVFVYSPVSIGVMTWGEKISLAIQVHPHVEMGQDKLEEIMDSWSKDLLSENNFSYWASSRTIDNPAFRMMS